MENVSAHSGKDKLLEDLDRRDWFQERSFLVRAPDESLYRLTAGDFPKGKNFNHHPILVLKAEGYNVVACPCTSNKRDMLDKSKFSYIREGTRLIPDRLAKDRGRPGFFVTDLNSYILHIYPFRIPNDPIFLSRMDPKGVVPEKRIAGGLRGSARLEHLLVYGE